MASSMKNDTSEFHFSIPQATQSLVKKYKDDREQRERDREIYAGSGAKQKLNPVSAAKELGLDGQLKGSLDWAPWAAAREAHFVGTGEMTEAEYVEKYGITSDEGTRLRMKIYGE